MPTDEAADDRPPHPVERQAVEEVLSEVDRPGEQHGERTPASRPTTRQPSRPIGDECGMGRRRETAGPMPRR